uniref:Uncharacterized protein n=1 Tax=Caenorhabditis japonica TaxID=281687 RepID=A0A8R1EN26_CAEJA
MLEELERNINPGVIIEDDFKFEAEMDAFKTEHIDETMDSIKMEEEQSTDEVDEMMEDVDVDMDANDFEDDNLAAGQILNDLAMSDSDDDERAEEVRRPNDDDHRLDSF